MEPCVAMGHSCQEQRVAESDSQIEEGEKSLRCPERRRGITLRIMMTVHFAGSINSSCVPKQVHGLRGVGAESLMRL